MLLAHSVDNIEKILLLDLPGLDILLLSELFEGLLPHFFLLGQLCRAFRFFTVVLCSPCLTVWDGYSQRRSRLYLIFLCRFHGFEGVKQDVEWFVLLLLVSHFYALRGRLHKLIESLNLSIVHAAARDECFQGFHVGRVLHDCGPVGVAAGRVHLLIVRRRRVATVVHLLKQV